MGVEDLHPQNREIEQKLKDQVNSFKKLRNLLDILEKHELLLSIDHRYPLFLLLQYNFPLGNGFHQKVKRSRRKLILMKIMSLLSATEYQFMTLEYLQFNQT